VGQGGEGIHSFPNTESNQEKKVFEDKWIYRSGIIGLSVRLKVDLVFEEGRILHVLLA
jgi:hypothetical protein